MTRFEQIALAYATGTEPTFTVAEMVASLEDLAVEEVIGQDVADLLRQAAARLKVTMTPQEIRAELQAVKASLPGSYYPSVTVSSHANTCSASIYLDQQLRQRVEAQADTWTGALSALRTKIADQAAAARTARIRQLALSIIDLTQDTGTASDIALRQRGFADAELADLHTAACTLAGEMAAGAPFSVTFTAGSNGAPATEAAE